MLLKLIQVKDDNVLSEKSLAANYEVQEHWTIDYNAPEVTEIIVVDTDSLNIVAFVFSPDGTRCFTDNICVMRAKDGSYWITDKQEKKYFL